MLYFCFLTEVGQQIQIQIYIYPRCERAKAPSSLRQWQISFLVKRNYDVKCVCGFSTRSMFVCVRMAFPIFRAKSLASSEGRIRIGLKDSRVEDVSQFISFVWRHLWHAAGCSWSSQQMQFKLRHTSGQHNQRCGSCVGWHDFQDQLEKMPQFKRARS